MLKMFTKKILTLLIFLIIFLNIFGLITVSEDKSKFEINILEESIILSKPIFEDNGECIKIVQENSPYYIKTDGNPEMPYINRNLIFPLGSIITDINVSFSSFDNISILKPIKINPKPLPISFFKSFNKKNSLQNSINFNTSLFPTKNYDCKLGIGYDGNERVVFLNLKIYPVRYSHFEKKLFYCNEVNLNIEYKMVKNKIEFPDLYDLLIIAPNNFLNILKPLVDHKNEMDVKTKIVTVEQIYNDFNLSGRDNAEKIKYFIKNSVEEFGIKYVLLVGGKQGQTNKWFVPVRYSNLDDYSYFDFDYISDLYYADIYKYDKENGYIFEDWDSNKNDIFGEWNRDSTLVDINDLYPDVYIGRLPCRNKIEVRNIVNKIISYESMKNNRWFNRMLIIGGDTFPNNQNDFEGEIETTKSASYIKSLGFDIIKMFASENTLRNQLNVIIKFSLGAGFIHIAGHGNPSVWSTHPPNSYNWIDGLDIIGMRFLFNHNRYPICIVGGCHNSQLSVSILNILEGIRSEGMNYFSVDEYDFGSFWKYEWVPECWSWRLISCGNSGSIATIGNTGLGYGYIGNYTLNGLSGWIEPHFFQVYADQGKDILGETHSQTIIDYINNFDVDKDRINRKTIEQWILFGDPSLKIGGYFLSDS